MTRSYSHENASNLPGGPARMDLEAGKARAAFERASRGEASSPDHSSGSDMVKARTSMTSSSDMASKKAKISQR